MPRRCSIAGLFARHRRGYSSVEPEHSPPPEPSPAQQPTRTKSRVLTRRRTSPSTPARSRTGERDTPRPERRRQQAPQQQNRQLRQRQPRATGAHRIYIDLRDTSDVWARVPARNKLSLNSVRPSTLFQGVEPPRLLRLLRRNSEPSRKRRPGRAPSHRRPTNGQVHDSHGAGGSDYVVMPLPAAPRESGMPVAREVSVRFSRLPAEQPLGAGALRRHEVQEAPAASPPALGDPEQRNRASTMSEDRCKHSSQVFRVLGRTSSCRSREASKPGDAAAPILVTIARNGSIVSDHNTGRSSDTADNTPQASLATDRPLEMAQSPPAGRHSSRGRSIPGASPSIGTGSFVTARMFPSASFEERGTPAPWPGAAVAGPPRVALSGRRRQSDEVSDIAMHKHLQIGDGHIDGDGQSSHDAQAQHRTISQAIRQASLLSSRAGAARDLEASTLRLAGPEQASANDGLLGRMSDLETRLTCLQAVMTNIEERLSGLALGPSGSLTVVQPPAAGLASGKTPLVGVVGASTVASSAPATAVQSATAALAELVARSRQEFDAAASSTLASLAEIVDIAPTTEL